MVRAVAVIDGEHYAPVVRDALVEVTHLVVAAVLVGGTEKLRGGEEYGVPLEPDLETAIHRHEPDVVLDLSDEPVLGPVERFRLAARALAAGVAYEGPGFRLDPPTLHPFAVPSLAIVGTGKRVGKTAVTTALARRAAASRSVVVVAMGRGGPEEPELITVTPTVDDLVALSRGGRHAASDHLETAALAGVPTIGCRRCGGGLAGAVATSTVLEGARMAAGLEPELVLFDGSGAALPPVETRARVLVAGANQPLDVLGGYLNPYRALISDLVLLTMSERASGWEAAAAQLVELVRPGTPVVSVVVRPEPAESVAGESVAYFGTASAAAASIERHLRERHDVASVTHVSGALADRARLRAELRDVAAETFVVELKAAAIDVVVEEALSRGARVVLARNDVVSVDGSDLGMELDRVLDLAGRRAEVAA
jgi:cyclic 2,3-diphosphoglycerate synthetase